MRNEMVGKQQRTVRSSAEPDATGLVVAIILAALLLFTISVAAERQSVYNDKAKEETKLVALADKMILASKRLSSTQDPNELAIIDEFVPLADYVVKTLGKK